MGIWAGAMVIDAVLKLKQKLYYLMGCGFAIFLMVFTRLMVENSRKMNKVLRLMGS